MSSPSRPLATPEIRRPPLAEESGPIPGCGLCLSGGGYRAMLFHIGSLWRLNEAGYLRKLDRISSVSGGSITAGVLGLHWDKLTFDNSDVATNFEEQVVNPLRGFRRCSLQRAVRTWIRHPRMTDMSRGFKTCCVRRVCCPRRCGAMHVRRR